jgi:hypothetical protein
MKWSSFCFKKQIETKKAPDFSEAFLVAGTGLEPVTFGL